MRAAVALHQGEQRCQALREASKAAPGPVRSLLTFGLQAEGRAAELHTLAAKANAIDL